MPNRDIICHLPHTCVKELPTVRELAKIIKKKLPN